MIGIVDEIDSVETVAQYSTDTQTGLPNTGSVASVCIFIVVRGGHIANLLRFYLITEPAGVGWLL
jgi:hypothetical protein